MLTGTGVFDASACGDVQLIPNCEGSVIVVCPFTAVLTLAQTNVTSVETGVGGWDDKTVDRCAQ